VATGPGYDLAALSASNLVDDQLIAASVATGAQIGVSRPRGRPVLEGESIFFSADSLAVIHLTFTPVS